MTNALATLFLAAVDKSEDCSLYSNASALEAALRHALHSARTSWPTVTISDKAFVRYLASRAPAPRDPASPLDQLHLGDLYLACGCAAGNPAALAAFEQEFGPELAKISQRFQLTTTADLLQRLREKLFVARPPHPPKIAEYAGLGFLQNWVRITTVRAFIDEQRRIRATSESPAGDTLALVADPDDDVELAYLKRHYRSEFRDAFALAVGTLTSGQRNLLRQRLVAGLTIDQLAAVYGIHRATAARRIADARQDLLYATRSALGERLGVQCGELDSVMRLINSQLDVSIVRLLDAHSVPPVPAG